MKYCVFDCETAVDKPLLLKAFGDELLAGVDLTEMNPDTGRLAEIGDDRKAEMAYQEFLNRNKSPNGRLPMVPLPCQFPVCISYGQVNAQLELIKINSPPPAVDNTDDIIIEFWQRFEQFDGTLVSFNGRGFDLPLLELHALRLGIEAPFYMERGRDRYHATRHIDLLDKITNYGAMRADMLRGGLDLLSSFIGGPAKQIHGSQVQELYEAGEYSVIASYCDADVLRTYLLFLRWQTLMGNLPADKMRQLSAAMTLKYAGA